MFDFIGYIITGGIVVIVLAHLLEFYFSHPGRTNRFDRQEWEQRKRELDLLMWAALLEQQQRREAAACSPELPTWANVLQVSHPITKEAVTAAHRKLSRQHHPDLGGSVARMQAVNDARDQAEAWLAKQQVTGQVAH